MVICSDDDSSVVKNGLEVLKNAKEKDNGFWIGYAKTWISNAYVGCEELDGGAEYSVPTLGECRRTTGCKTFGIQKLTTGLRCKCSSENALRTQTCGETCKEGDKYPCGDTADTNIFSVYTVENGSTAGAAAGVSVSLVLLIIVTIIVLIFMKRRGLLTKCNKQNDEKSNHTEDTATEIACISTPIFESTTNTMDDLTVTNHSYFVLEKTFDEETKEDTDHYAEPDTTDVDHYDLTDESQKDTDIDYDTADDKNSSAKSELSKPNNSYN
ncbi:hypothetical protein MAR_014424, partial [Mya arenaria]